VSFGVDRSCLETLIDSLAAARSRVQFLEEQLRIEQAERASLQGRYDIIDARYKQVEERWHKLMSRTELQCQNRMGQPENY